jgi:deleted-in-malignant-brain-tumors protein 1
VAVVEGASPPLILFESTTSSVPIWPPGTLLRFGMTGSTSTTAVAVLPVLGRVEQVGVCDSPYDGEVRIAGGGSSGRLEIFHQGRWGTVCDDNFGTVDANVACRQLGYASGTARTDVAGGADPIWLDEVGCTGTELGLGTCAHPAWGTHDCTHVDDVGVSCVP